MTKQLQLLCEGWSVDEGGGTVWYPPLRYCRQQDKVWVADGKEHLAESTYLTEAQGSGLTLVESLEEMELEERKLPNGEVVKLPKNGLWVLEGPAQASDAENANKRKYPRAIWERLIGDPTSYAQKAIKGRSMVGVFEHPKDGRTRGPEVCILTTESTLRPDGVVWNRFELLDTPNGQILQSLTRQRVRWGVSTRGNGAVDNNGVVEDKHYVLECWDAVMKPSVIKAVPAPVGESLEARARAVCEDAHATLEQVMGLQREAAAHYADDGAKAVWQWLEDKVKAIHQGLEESAALADLVRLGEQDGDDGDDGDEDTEPDKFDVVCNECGNRMTVTEMPKACEACGSEDVARVEESTKGAYPFAEKAARYRDFTVEALEWSRKDAAEAAKHMKGFDPAAEGWYLDDYHTIVAEINRRRKQGKVGESVDESRLEGKTLSYKGETYVPEEDADEDTVRYWSDLSGGKVTLHDTKANWTGTVKVSQVTVGESVDEAGGDYAGFCRQATDAQLRAIIAKEHKANRRKDRDTAEAEAKRRGWDAADIKDARNESADDAGDTCLDEEGAATVAVVGWLEGQPTSVTTNMTRSEAMAYVRQMIVPKERDNFSIVTATEAKQIRRDMVTGRTADYVDRKPPKGGAASEDESTEDGESPALMESLRQQLQDQTEECESSRTRLEEAQQQAAALSQERDELAQQLDTARTVLAESTEQEAEGEVETAVAEAIKGSPRLEPFRAILLEATNREAVGRLAEGLRPYTERHPAPAAPPAKRLRLPLGGVSSEPVSAPKVSLTEDNHGASLAARALNPTMT